MTDTDTETLGRRDESVPWLFSRLTKELAQLVDTKLELLKVQLKQETGAYAMLSCERPTHL